ncbi:hypothetical protein C5S39_09180 [Candidatus Methanophagaceae archaeon]|nr:hypothetical protein C5S39_09180 [Methanophagales archaeon]
MFVQRLVSECREQLSVVYPLSAQEMEFLDRILTKGQIEPSLLTTDTEVQDRITRNPMLLWKAVNVRRHFGIGG